eukprot:Selendium_serpulae@DN5115_c0_g1_i2.p3
MTESETAALQEVYSSFTHNQAEMDGRTFVKLLKDSKIIDKTYTSTDADILFTKTKKDGKRGSTKINFAEFQKAIGGIAAKKKKSPEEIASAILTAGGPVFRGTKADDVRFYDDKTLFTGVHAHGGPTTVDSGRTGVSDLSEITNRSAATVRGVDAKIDKAAK